ncbi:hypothetical protein EVAR_87787_1 [Eumeta japonica]|uniref:Uncharacterized protein n=1 Tax=Eumeta variegata TaxID=151549 RepID=A0A4C1X774_EUMVA|nr:hypothetical protein EVAR_87787_1 [Eumeta japonica]
MNSRGTRFNRCLAALLQFGPYDLDVGGAMGGGKEASAVTFYPVSKSSGAPSFFHQELDILFHLKKPVTLMRFLWGYECAW